MKNTFMMKQNFHHEGASRYALCRWYGRWYLGCRQGYVGLDHYDTIIHI